MPTDPRNPWTTSATRVVYENPWIRVREDRVLRPDGQPGIYGVVEIPPSIAVLAMDDRDRLILVGQWRYTRNRYSWETPVGAMQPGDSSPEAAAARELAEETGLEAQQWRPLGRLEASIGVTTDTQWMFLATGLTQRTSRPDPDERIETRWVTFDQAVNEVLSGDICEAASVASILKLETLRRRPAVAPGSLSF